MHTRLIKHRIERVVDSKYSMKFVELGYRLFKNYTCEGLTQKAFVRYRQATDKKPLEQIREEVRLCRQFWKCYPLHYFRYDLYRSEKELTRRQLLNYIPEFFFYNLFVPYHDSMQKKYIIEDKVITDQIFRSIGVAVPETIGCVYRNRIYDSRFNQITYRQLEARIRDLKPDRFLIKPVRSGGGKGIVVFSRTGRNRYTAGDQSVFSESYLNRLNRRHDYLIQSGIRQIGLLSRIYPHSVNSLRIISENLNGKAGLLYGILRMGRSGNEIDNLSQKGIFAEIDMETGQISEHAVSKDCQVFHRHPDTGVAFKHQVIPNWGEIKTTLSAWVEKTPNFTYLGWDVALTDAGPVVIEANIGFGLDSIQILSGGMREAFGIDDPAKYWNSRGAS